MVICSPKQRIILPYSYTSDKQTKVIRNMSDKETRQNELGSIMIQKEAIASIARQSTLTSYGVVGLAPKDLAENEIGRAHV